MACTRTSSAATSQPRLCTRRSAVTRTWSRRRELPRHYGPPLAHVVVAHGHVRFAPLAVEPSAASEMPLAARLTPRDAASISSFHQGRRHAALFPRRADIAAVYGFH